MGRAHTESTGLLLRGAREGGVDLAFFLLASCKSGAPSPGTASCQQPSPATPGDVALAVSCQPHGLPSLADRVS